MLSNILLALLITYIIVDMPTLPNNVANPYTSPVDYFVAIGSTLVRQLVTYGNFRDGAFKFACLLFGITGSNLEKRVRLAPLKTLPLPVKCCKY